MIDKFIKDNHLNKYQIIGIFALMIVCSGMFGWAYEVIFYYINSGFKEVYMRGGNFLPFINIYVYGSLLIFFLTYRFKDKPLLVFLISMISTGILEFLSGYVLYGILGWTKCWDYNTEILNFGNIGGYVCLRSVLVFGLCGLILIYLMIPILIKISKKLDSRKFMIISVIICSIFLIDEVYNLIFCRLLGFYGAPTFYKSLGFKYIYFK